MTVRLVALALSIVLLAAWALTHVAVTWVAVRAERYGWQVRLLAVIAPPVAPMVAWSVGRRRAPITWALLGAAYVLSRLALA